MPRRRPQLLALERRDVPSTVVESEPNDFFLFANPVIPGAGDVLATAPADWLTVIGSIGDPLDRDSFKIELNQPATLWVDLDSRDVGLSNTLDTFVEVVSANGSTVLASNNDGYDFDTFAAPTAAVSQALSADSALAVVLPAGAYIVRVSSFGAESTGSYHLRLFADPSTDTQAPIRASLPGAPFTILLDVDGDAASSDWGTYSVAGFDLDGTPGSFSSLERFAIDRIWRIVAEDLSPFHVNVTTVEPASPQPPMLRAVVTSSSPTALGLAANARGAAKLGALAGPEADVVFVFHPAMGDYLGGSSGLAVAAPLEQGQEVSRRLGTALGLRDYGGVYEQPTGIMQGPDLGLSRSTWSAGPTHSGQPPVVNQDDVAMIVAPGNGIVGRPDDHAATIADATALPVAGGVGVLETSSDRDVFSFVSPGGNASLTAMVDAYSGNGDLTLRVYDSAGTLLAVTDPTVSFDAKINISLGAGTYFAEVGGRGGPGDLGGYRLDISFSPLIGPPQVVSSFIGGDTPQRSMIPDVILAFNRIVQFPFGVGTAVNISSSTGNTPIVIDEVLGLPGQTTLRIRFPEPGGGFGSIANGRYTLRIFSAFVTDLNNQLLDGDFSGQAGGDFVQQFHRLFGDINGDARVDSVDFLAFRIALLSPAPEFDFDANGIVNAADFLRFRIQFLTSV